MCRLSGRWLKKQLTEYNLKQQLNQKKNLKMYTKNFSKNHFPHLDLKIENKYI